jgi:hypothetical protein
MSKQTINIGASPNDGTGTPLRTSFDYTNQNFTELYTALGGGVGLPGATTQVIFNDGGTNLAGDAGLVYNKTTDALTVAGLVTAGSATITGAATVGTTLGVTGVSTLASASITGAATVGTTLGVTGVSTFAAGTALLPALTTTGDTNTGIYYPAADTFAVTTGGTERYRVDSAGNVGIGVTPSAWSVYKSLDLPTNGYVSSGNSWMELMLNAFFDGSSYKYKDNGFASHYLQQSGFHAWYTAPSGTAGNAITFTQAMTLDASRNLLVGTTNTSATAGPGFKSQFSSTVPQFAIVVNEAGTSTSLSIYNVSAAAYRFYVNNGGTVFATNTVISAISDARLKENVQDIDVGLNAILSLKPRKFDWKAGKGKDIKGDRGFIAQEFEAVFPNLVDEWKDQAPEGESPYKSVRQDLIPVLVKAIQELTARVQTLETR